MYFSRINSKVATAILSYLGFFALAVLLVVALRASLILICIAFLLAYILNPVVNYCELKFRWLNRSIISLVISLLTLIIILLLPAIMTPFLIEQGKVFTTHVPELITTINNKVLNPFNDKFNTHFIISVDWIKQTALANLGENKVDLATVAPIAKSSLFALNGVIGTILLPFVLFYVIRDWRIILFYCGQLIPRRYESSAMVVLKDIDKSLSYYLRGQILVMLIMALIYALALNIAGLPAATIIGIITGLLVFIPYLGFFIGVFLALLMSISNFEGMWQLIKILIALGIGNLIENFVATPFLVGDSIGLNPVMIIFALIICGNLFGIIGVIASLPLTAIGVVLIKHLYNFYLESSYYKNLD